MRSLSPIALMTGAALLAACGGASNTVLVPVTGANLCLEGRRVCVSFPSGALPREVSARLSVTMDRPPFALTDAVSVDIQGPPVELRRPVTVSYAYEGLSLEALPSEQVLRVFHRDATDWSPLDQAVVDRVQRRVSGESMELGVFMLYRVDRLTDGGLPVAIDSGVRDSGSVIIIPPIPDAGRPDAGPPDAGRPDAGPMDAGQPDAGGMDAGGMDAGGLDAGPVDAGGSDAGVDAGPVDAGAPDAGPPDAGPPDAGPPDAGPPDAGPDDAGAPDAGSGADAGEADAGADAGSGDSGM